MTTANSVLYPMKPATLEWARATLLTLPTSMATIATTVVVEVHGAIAAANVALEIVDANHLPTPIGKHDYELQMAAVLADHCRQSSTSMSSIWRVHAIRSHIRYGVWNFVPTHQIRLSFHGTSRATTTRTSSPIIVNTSRRLRQHLRRF